MYGSLLWLAVYADVNSVSLQSDSKASFSVETTEKAEHQSTAAETRRTLKWTSRAECLDLPCRLYVRLARREKRIK